MHFSKTGYRGLPAVALVILAVGLFAVMHVMPYGVSWAKAMVWSAFGIASVLTALFSYRYADEVQLQMQKSAFFWGSMAAICSSIPVVVLLGWGLIPLPVLGSMRAGAYFALGFGFLLLAEGVGFVAICFYRRVLWRNS